jgi:hypothetical protein
MLGFMSRTSRRPSRSRSGPMAIESLERRSMLATYTVTNTSGDVGVPGSLPWAVQQANYATPDQLDFIVFNIAPAGPKTITLSATLYLNDQAVIDGKSQPGYVDEPVISVEGDGTVDSIFLLQNADGDANPSHVMSTVQGLGMFNFRANGVTIFSSTQANFIQDNWIGFRRIGGTVQRNTDLGPAYVHSRGIGIQSSWNTIRNNTISGVDNGITVGDPLESSATSPYVTNSFSNNRIGTDPAGMTAAGYGNTSDGIFLGKNAREMWIGPANTLSGNASAGVELLHATNWHNIIFSNFIGTDRTGTAAIGNGELGVLLANGANENAVGGPWGGNVISGNTLGGVALGTAAWGVADRNWVQYNTIGLNVDQTAALPGQQVGVSIEPGCTLNTVEWNTIGGSVSHGLVANGASRNSLSRNSVGRTAAGHVIANGGYGLVLLVGANYNWVLENSFGSNALGATWVSPSAVGNIGL